MIPTLKAEFRKLLTVRSTYIVAVVAAVFIAIVCLYAEGYKGNTSSPAAKLSATALEYIMTSTAGLVAVTASLVAILLVVHEYRYSTIMYTLTANARRSQVVLAKIVAVISFALVFGLLMIGWALASYGIGLALRGAALPAQDVHFWVQLGYAAYYFVGYALVGLGLAFITRNITACVAILLITISTIEPILGALLFKDNSKYLPFNSLDAVLGMSGQPAPLAPSAALGVSAIYLGVLVGIAWLLFLRRDVS